MDSKGFLVMLICLIFMSACGKTVNREYKGDTATSTAVSATESPLPTKKQLSCEVTDLIGKKRKLTLPKGHMPDEAVIEMDSFNYITEYSQVENDNYYYMRMTGDAQYSIYKNQGENIGSFYVGKEQHPFGCVKYGGNFYIKFLKSHNYDGNPSTHVFLARVSFERQRLDVLYEYIEKHTTRINFVNQTIRIYDGNNSFNELNLLEGKRRIVQYDNGNDKNELFYRYSADDMMYADGVREEDKIVFWCYNSVTGEKEKYFCYSYIPPIEDKWKFDYSVLEVNNNDVYICEIYSAGGTSYRTKLYVISHKDKKMNKILDGSIESYRPFKHNVFYTDSDHKIHKYRISTQKDTVISNIKAMDIACTKEGLYVKKYNEDLADSEPKLTDDFSCGLYFMDFDGKNVVEIEKEKIEME